MAVWWAWMNRTWLASAFDDDAQFRGLTMVVLGGCLLFAGGASYVREHLAPASALAGSLDAMAGRWHLDRALAAVYVSLPVAIWLLALRAIRDVRALIGWRRVMLLAAETGFAALAWRGTAPVAVATLSSRFRIGPAKRRGEERGE